MSVLRIQDSRKSSCSVQKAGSGKIMTGKKKSYPRDLEAYPIMVGVGSHSVPALYVDGRIVTIKDDAYRIKKK